MSLSDISPEPAKRWLREKQAAELTGLKQSRLTHLRWAGGGPPFAKVERTVLYEESELIAWLESKTVTSTSDKALEGK